VRRAAACVLLGLLGPVPVATGGGLRDLADAWLASPGQTASMLRGRDAATPGRWSVAVGQGRLYELPELPQCGLELGWRASAAGVSASWERLGRDLYREDTWRLAALVGRRVRWGAQVGVARLALGGRARGQSGEATLRLQAELPAGHVLDVWWPLTVAPPWYGSEGLRRWLRLSGAGDGWAWCAALDRSAGGAPIAQGEVLVRLAPIAAFGLRVEPWSGTIGCVTAWRLGGLLLRSSHLVHPDLGTTHRGGLVAGSWR